MNEEHSTQPILAEAVEPVLKTHWEAIQAKRLELVEVLEQMATSFPEEGRKRLGSLSSWFSEPRSFEQALMRVDVLAVCLPLSKSLSKLQGSDQDLGKADIASAARVGFCSIGQSAAGGYQLVRTLAYPAVVLVGALLVACALSVFVVPQFETMFAEFGIELPVITQFFIESARLLRVWTWVVVVWIASLMAIIWFLNGVTSRRRPDGLGWLDLWTKSSRMALADWAWHISLLLEAGLTQKVAMRKAGRFAGKSWLRESSDFWAERNEYTSSDGKIVFDSDVLPRRYLKSPKYRLLDHALAVPDSPGKIHLLREIAIYYRDRNRTIGLWWIEWLAAVLLWTLGFIILMFVFAVFSPLIAITSGLTG